MKRISVLTFPSKPTDCGNVKILHRFTILNRMQLKLDANIRIERFNFVQRLFMCHTLLSRFLFGAMYIVAGERHTQLLHDI